MGTGKRRWLFILLIAAIAALAVFFLTGREGPPSRPADIEGRIAAVEEQGRVLLVHTARSPEPDFRVRITTRTKVFQRQDGGIVRAETWSPAAGQQVRIWVDGPVLESFPAQAAAGTILVLD